MSTPTASAEDEIPFANPDGPDIRLFRAILNQFKNSKTNNRIEVFIINGIKLVGKLVDFDDEGLLLDSESQGRSLIRRSAISTIMLKQPTPASSNGGGSSSGGTQNQIAPK